MSIALKPYSPKPFRIPVPDTTLLDLRRRLRDVHWPDEVARGWDYGVDLQYLRSFVDYWRDEYDWRTHEARLNELAHYTVEIDSIDHHYVHV
jgi:hypothetical protein